MQPAKPAAAPTTTSENLLPAGTGYSALRLAAPAVQRDLDLTAHVRGDDDLLRRAHARGVQGRGYRNCPLDQGKRDRPQLVVPGRGAHEANCRVLVHDRLAVRGQPVRAAIKMQQNEPPRRMTQVVHSGDGLLAPVAPLVQVHGGLEPAHLMRNRPMVDVSAEPGPVSGDA